jgi:hypothetical protein
MRQGYVRFGFVCELDEDEAVADGEFDLLLDAMGTAIEEARPGGYVLDSLTLEDADTLPEQADG